MADKFSRKIQIGQEATAGTPVAATTIWRGPGADIEDQREMVFNDEDVGYIPNVSRSHVPKLQAALSPPETEATFEQLPYILAAAIKNVVSGSADGAGDGKIYDYTLPTTAANTIKTMTLEAGDNQQAYEMEYGFVTDFKLSMKPGEAIKMSANWVGRQKTKTTYTAALSLPSVEEILGSKSILSIDDNDGAFGDTAVSNTLLGWELSCVTGWKPRFRGSGNLYFPVAAFDAKAFEMMLNLTFEYNASAVSEVDDYEAETTRLIQLSTLGSAFDTGGTTYANKAMILNLAGMWEKFEVLDEQDGNDIVTGIFRGTYEPSAALFGNIIVVNSLASLP